MWNGASGVSTAVRSVAEPWRVSNSNQCGASNVPAEGAGCRDPCTDRVKVAASSSHAHRTQNVPAFNNPAAAVSETVTAAVRAPRFRAIFNANRPSSAPPAGSRREPRVVSTPRAGPASATSPGSAGDRTARVYQTGAPSFPGRGSAKRTAGCMANRTGLRP